MVFVVNVTGMDWTVCSVTQWSEYGDQCKTDLKSQLSLSQVYVTIYMTVDVTVYVTIYMTAHVTVYIFGLIH